MTRGTRTRERELSRRLRELRREWRDWMSGRAFATALWYGAPWCQHRQPDPDCEGCPTRRYCRDRAAEVEAEAARVQAELEGPAEDELLTLTSRGWVTV